MRRVMASFEAECLSHSLSAWAAVIAWFVVRAMTHGYVRQGRDASPHG